MEYLFILGTAGELCRAELEAVLEREKISFQKIFSSTELFHLKTSVPLDTNKLIKTLGGTIKVAEVFIVLQTIEQKEIIAATVEILKQVQNDTVNKMLNFGFSGYGDIHYNDLYHCSVEVKNDLEKNNLRTRFILPRDELSLSSVVIKKQHLTEIILSKEEEKLILAKTLVVQDFEDWGKRDFGRPEADPKSGMLPPKVARMMVNIANSKFEIRNSKFTLLDPFCGMGTILAEGMAMGYEVIGTDISEVAVQKSQKNLEWIVSKFKVQSLTLQLRSGLMVSKVEPSKFKVFQMDATHVSEKLPAGSVDAIVTEPYLGPSNVMLNLVQHPQEILKQVQNDRIHNVILGLDKLYLGCLREWRKILKPGGTVVIALPSFKIGSQEFFVKKAIDTCENLGYTLLAGPYQYNRPQAVVKRNIYILKRHSGLSRI